MRTFGLFFLLPAFLIQWVQAQDLPTQTSTLFSGSGNCASCHEPGGMNPNALVDDQGRDVSPVTLWRSTMMANASRDPFWRAKVSAEVQANPHLKRVIEDKCTTCHAPMGRTEAVFQGRDGYTLEEAKTDPLARDGVSCTVCHQIQDANLGKKESFSGGYTIRNDRVIFGPFQNPVTGPMQMTVNFTPTYSPHIQKSELCATCHTLFTPYVDNEGNIVGEAPEQVPYLEWKNSIYPGQNIQCQTCHMPDADQAIVISNRPRNLSARSPFAKHYFVGGNVYMLKLLKRFGQEIGVTATAAQFDSTIKRTLHLLQKETAELTAVADWQQDSLMVKVAVRNLAGHKFPTAYPSRRAWVWLRVTDEGNQVVFESGAWKKTTGEIIGLDEDYEPHYQVITRPDQVQVYEAVMKDIDGKVNYTLLRAAGYLKDNRLPPAGFKRQHADYAYAAIEGLAADDPDFNQSGQQEGTGTDTLWYRIGGLNPTRSYTVEIKLLYQTLNPRFVKDLFQYDTPEVQTFQSYYEQMPNTPITIDSLLLAARPTGVTENQRSGIVSSMLLVRVYPNPFNPATTINVEIRHGGKLQVRIVNLLGQEVRSWEKDVSSAGVIPLVWNGTGSSGETVQSGTYFIRVRFRPRGQNTEYYETLKVVFLK